MINKTDSNYVKRTKTYLLSDLHLGAPYIEDAKAHESRIINFLNSVQDDAKTIYLLGDIFDFWYEYKEVIPKGFIRFQGKIAELCDKGIDVQFFCGNHDMWMFTYFQNELGVKVHHGPQIITIDNKTYFLAHGEDLGVEDKIFLKLLQVFRSKIAQWCFSTMLHPDFAMRLAHKWSNKSRLKNGTKETTTYLGENNEHLVKFAKSYKGEEHIDFFIFGHRHILLDLMIKKDSRVIILGDWIQHFSYAEVENDQLSLLNFEEN